ncbi:hypothetical protein SAMN05216201_11140 [Pseudomonas linyingensis]|uniref:Uncharacterized protein n=1 Tax=Pseudomonas linyingensis TaxID=915471 RepID=A0A1H7A5V4_9PSED|nr:hypothetical protein [Pseudomonas linyingensis]SEJ57250.1 hypothetical protein SAMN05216201_11140 [Pseudomonas linyingensis]
MDFIPVKSVSLGGDCRPTLSSGMALFSASAHAEMPPPVLRARYESARYASVDEIASSQSAYIDHIVHGIESNTRLKTPGAITIPAANTPNALVQVMAKVRAYASLEDGWDGYGGVKIESSTRNDAELFAAFHAADIERVMPKVSPAGDGEINFSWSTGRGVIDLGFYGDGSYSYYAVTEDGREFFSDEEALSKALPEEVAKIIA